MNTAIGVIELNSIARGIEVCDFMLKTAAVEVLRSSTVCPGKYIIIIGGETSDVEASIASGIEHGAEFVIETLILPNVHPQVAPAISLANPIEIKGAVGVMEFYSITSAIRAADIAAKAANVTLIEVRIGFAIGGKGFVTMTGDVADVEEAVRCAVAELPMLVGTSVIPRPDPRLFDSLM